MAKISLLLKIKLFFLYFIKGSVFLQKHLILYLQRKILFTLVFDIISEEVETIFML